MPRDKPKPRYKWDDWFKKRRFRLRRGTHFDCMPHSMAQMVRNNASKRKLRVSVDIEEEAVIVTNWTVTEEDLK